MKKVVVENLGELAEKLDELDAVDKVVIDVPWGTRTRELEFSDFKEIVEMMIDTKKRADSKWSGDGEDEEGLDEAIEEINRGFDEVMNRFGLRGTSVMAELAAGAFVPFRKLVLFMDGNKLYVHGFEDDSCLL